MVQRGMRCVLLRLLCLSLFSSCLFLGSGCASSGYFLNAKQKGQLIQKGRMQDRASGDWYDVRIVPGYEEPIRRAGDGLRDTGDALAKYGSKKHWQRTDDNIGNALEWGWNDGLYDFGIKGSGKAWTRSFGAAKKRVDRRVFGWWLAYPWAALSASAENVVRIPVGATGAVAGSVWGLGVVPAYSVLRPAGDAAWSLGVDTVLVPGSAAVWNTVVAPPLALVGERPAPGRTDGFWVRQLSEEQLAKALAAERRLSEADLQALEAWGQTLLDESSEVVAREAEINETYREGVERLERKRTEERDGLWLREDAAMRARLSAHPSRPGAAARFGSEAGVYSSALRERMDLSWEEWAHLQAMLKRFPPSLEIVEPLEKTDPVREVIETVKEIGE